MQSLNISTAALRSVQQSLDNTANNLANIETVGYKRRGSSFSELLVDSMNEQPFTDKQRTSPPGLRIGSGAKLGLTKLDMSQGSAKVTEIPSDLMIEGEGFFLVSRRPGTLDENGLPMEEYRFTRNGAFHLSPATSGDNNLVTASGDYLVDESGNPIEIPANGSFRVESNGQLIIDGFDSGIRIGVWKVDNPDQYEQLGDNEFLAPVVSGERPDTTLQLSSATIRQGTLELSNVEMRQEMSQLVTTQRAYQLNSRAIAISDQMMGIANSLRSR